MKKFKCFALFGITLLLALVSCGNSDSSNDSSIVEETYYTVFFDTAGGSTIDSQSVKEGDRVKRPNKPVRNGYTFSGWLNEGESYSFLESVYSDITLTASWIAMANQLTLSTNLEGASTLVGSGRYETDEDVTIESKTNPGYEFVGWYFGDSLISNKEIYNFKMWPESVNYEARYIKSSNVQYKVNHYKISFAYETELVETEVFYGTTGTLLNTSDYVKEYENYHWVKGTSSYPLNGDGTTEVEVYYALDTYNLKLNTNNSQYGVTKSNGSIIKAATIEYGTNNTIEAVPNPGYTFIGWYDENGLVSEDSKYTFTMPANDLVYEARFAPSTNTLYKVEHYLQNIDNTSYPATPYEVDELYGTTNTSTEATAKIYDGFTAQSVTQQTINSNGTTVVKIYYTRSSYSITLNRNNTSAGTVTGAVWYKYGKSITIKATANPGYTFVGWYDENGLVSEDAEYTFTMPSNNLTYEARFTANTDTPYKVEHYLQNIDNTSYPSTPYEVDNLYGTTNVDTEATAKTYDGFTSPSVTQKTISGNGSTIIKLYYTRNSYTITLNRNNTSAGSVSGAGTYKYGKTITIKAIATPGYTFIGWYDENGLVYEDSEYSFEMPVNNLTYEARFTPNTNIPYKVEHYLQNTDDDKYVLIETDNLYGTTGDSTKGELNEYEGFIAPTISQSTIKGDGSTIVKYYYDRIEYKVTMINYFNGTPNKQEVLVRYNGTYKIEYDMYLGCDISEMFINSVSIELSESPNEITILEDTIIDVFYVSKEEMELFNFTSTKTTVTLTGIKDNTVTEIVVPDYVTNSSPSIFQNCNSLVTLKMPYILKNPDSYYSGKPSSYFPLGYLFMTTSTINTSKTEQKVYLANSGVSRTVTYYIPNSLTNVILTGTNKSSTYFHGEFMNCSILKSVTILDGITSIGPSTFSGCSNLTNVILPTSITSIGYEAFYKCSSLTSITIPDSVTSIGNYAFFRCSSLTSITIPEGVTSISANAFSGCSSLTNITIPSDVTSIESYAFSGCSSLITVIILNGTVSISSTAFESCASIEKVYYYGTELEWRRIGYTFADTVTMIYYSEIEPTDEGNYWHYVDGVVTEW